MSVATVSAPAGPSVGIGQIVVSADRATVISALGLGSCIGVVMFDPSAHVAGMAHVMLPESGGKAGPLPGKFADTAVPALLEELGRIGGERTRLVVKIAGGAQMFGAGSGGGLLKIGERNAEAVGDALTAAGLRIRGSDTGGSRGRTMGVTVGTGVVTVRAVGAEEIQL